MKPLKTASDFIRFFRAIPDEKWRDDGILNDGIRACAMGHLRSCFYLRREPNQNRLTELIDEAYGKKPYPFATVFDINNGRPEYRHLGSTPRERILVALENIRGAGG